MACVITEDDWIRVRSILIALRSYDEDVFEKLVDNDDIDPPMSFKDIKEIIEYWGGSLDPIPENIKLQTDILGDDLDGQYRLEIELYADNRSSYYRVILYLDTVPERHRIIFGSFLA